MGVDDSCPLGLATDDNESGPKTHWAALMFLENWVQCLSSHGAGLQEATSVPTAFGVPCKAQSAPQATESLCGQIVISP